MDRSSSLGGSPALWLLAPVWLSLKLWQAGMSPIFAGIAALLIAAGFLLILQPVWEAPERLIGSLVAFLAAISCAWCLSGVSFQPVAAGRFDGTVTVCRQFRSSSLVRDGAGRLWGVSGPIELRPDGGTYHVIGDFGPLTDEPSDRQERLFWLSLGAVGRIKASSAAYLGEEPGLIAAARRFLQKQIGALPPLTGGVLGAVLLGDREGSTSERFRSWGLLHMLAVSGWHVGIVAALASLILGRGPRGAIGTSAVLWLYVALSGWSVSAVRAAVMAQGALIGFLSGRPGASLNSAALSLLALLLWQPGSFASISWQLSGLAVLMVTGVAGWKFPPFASWIVLPTIVWFVTSPIASPLSGGLFWSSLPINLMLPLFLPVFGLTVLLSLASLLTGWEFLAQASEQVLSLWGAASDGWVHLIPQALPSTGIPLALCWALAAAVLCRPMGLTRFRSLTFAVGSFALGSLLSAV
ncbi:ComEC/Rec2-like protein [Jonquetella anthropi E3_33 E1]|nr:ComEC/Rec2-like protein [Jonquetella anthropi E3_33 E1]